MSTRKLWCATGFLCMLTAGTVTASAADRPVPGEPKLLTIPGCTVRFVEKSTYATDRPGIIAELPFEEGDRVPAGNLIIRLRDAVAEANLKLRAQQAAMRTAILIAEKERLAASMELADKRKANAIFQASVTGDPDPNELPFNSGEIKRLEIINDARLLQVQQAEEEYGLNQVAHEQAQAELDTYRVHAEFSGLVTRVEKHVGEAVNAGDPILTIVNPSRVRVEGYVKYADARRMQVGDPVYVQLALPDEFSDQSAVTFEDSIDRRTAAAQPERKRLPEEEEVFTGRIGFIDVATKSDTGIVNEVRIWAEVTNRNGILLEGLPAEIKVQTRER